MKRFVISILFILLMLGITGYAFELSGKGTFESPYIINSYEDFYSVAEEIKNGDSALAASHFQLNASIDFYGRSYLPIGTNENPFTGVFDGNGYTLNDIEYTTVGTASGVFAYAENAVIKNLGVVDAKFILGGNAEAVYCGIICGSFKKSETNPVTDIEKCFATGSVNVVAPNAYMGYAGGIAGSIVSSVSGGSLNISNCQTDCVLTVTANSVYCGGFAGYVESKKSTTTVEIEYLYTKGTFTAKASSSNAYCGGMIGYLKAEESGWGEWTSEEGQALLSATSYTLSNSISLSSVTAESTSGQAYASYTVSQTESGPTSSKLYCTGTDNANGGIKGTTVAESSVTDSSFLNNTLGFDLEKVWSLDGGLNIIRNNALCGTSSIDGKNIHVRINGYSDGKVLVAAYDSNERLTEVKIGNVCGNDGEINVSFTKVPVSIRTFALENTTASPICPEITLGNVTKA